MALNFLQQLLLPEGLFLRPGEELLIPVRYRVTGDESSLELSGLVGMVLYDPTQLSFLGYDEQTALSVDLFQEPDQSYSEADQYESLSKSGKKVNPDLDGVEATTAAIPFIYLTGFDAKWGENWDGNPNWPGPEATPATSETGLTLFNLKFEALPDFSGSPLTVIVLDTHEGYSGLGDETIAELEETEPDPENAGSIETKIQLRSNNNNSPGDVIASKAIGIGDTFFIEILAADNRPNPSGIIGIQLDLNWDSEVLEVLELRLSENLPINPSGTIDNNSGKIDDAGAGSLPESGNGQAIGVGEFEGFATILARAEKITSVSSQIQTSDIAISNIALADGTTPKAAATTQLDFSVIKGPKLRISDSHGIDNDASVTFVTPITSYRTSAAKDSDLVRPTFKDAWQYITFTNDDADEQLIIDAIEVNAPNVTTDYDFITQGGISLNPGQSHQLGLLYKPKEAGEVTDIANGLVVTSNAVNGYASNVRIVAKSTYSADINYDGAVGFGDLGPLNASWGSSAGKTNWDPTADINGDGSIGFGDFGLLNNQWGGEL